jgi:hypothetical protein
MGKNLIVQPGCTMRSMPKEEFKQEDEKAERTENGAPVLYFKLYKPDPGNRLETAALQSAVFLSSCPISESSLSWSKF